MNHQETPVYYQREDTVDLREYLHILRRRRLLIIGVVLAVVAGTLLASWRMTPIYAGVSRVEIQPVGATSDETAQLLEAIVDPSRRLQTQVELIKSQPVLERAAEELGLPSTEELEESLEVELLTDTQIVEITVEHPVAEEAADWANAVATAYIAHRRDRALEQILASSEEIERRVAETKGEIQKRDAALANLDSSATQLKAERDRLQAELATEEAELSAPQPSPAPISRFRLNQIEEMRVRIAEIDRQIEDFESGGDATKAERDTLVARLGALEAQRDEFPNQEDLQRGGGDIIVPAVANFDPVRPKIVRNGILALVLGLMLGVGFAFLAEALDDRIRKPEEVEERIGAPILGYIPFIKEQAVDPELTVAAVEDPHSGVAEAFRTLRTNIRFLFMKNDMKTLLITSAHAGEGKSTVAANLAVVSAQGGTRTILVSADLRKPAVHKPLGLKNDIGLVHALDPDFPLDRALQTNGVEEFRLLGSGGVPPYPAEIVASARFTDLMINLREATDLVVYDSPPILGIADSSTLASKVDGVILIVDPRISTRRTLAHAADQIGKAGGRILGAVLNAVDPDEGYGYYYQYYYYSYTDGGAKPEREAVPAPVGGPVIEPVDASDGKQLDRE